MCCLFSLISKKSLAVFLLALLVGLYSGGLFERYVFNFAFVPNFSFGEVNRLKGETVRDVCYERQAGKERIGKVTGYSGTNYTLVRVRVVWNNEELSMSTDYPKSYFSNCVKVAE